MDFSFTSDQQLLAQGVRDFLASECPPEAVRAAWDSGPDMTRWKALAGLGVVGLLVPEDLGGLGMNEVDLCLLLEEAGYAGLPEPLAEVAAVAVPLLVDAGGDAGPALLQAAAAGEAMVLPALEVDRHPAHLATADQILVQRGDELHLVRPTSVTLDPRPNVDGARPTSSLSAELDAASTAIALDVGDALERASARGVWAASAALVGVARRMIDLATDYALQREQFGRPIGSFQAVKHHLATALVEVEFARPLVHRAAWSLAAGDGDAPVHASMAKAVASEAAQSAARAALQVHGAIGYTWEHDLHLWMKRAWSLAASWGPAEAHWERIESATLG